MDCIMNSGVFLRANGDLVCWDDAGCNTILQPYDAAIDYGQDVFLGKIYNQIRGALKSDTMPHPTICGACLALNPTQPFSPNPVEQKRISYLQIESSFACQLRCPNCYPGVDRKGVLQRGSGGHLNLKTEALEKILNDFCKSGISINVVEFQGHGEPLINKLAWDMIRTTRRLFPQAHIRVITNGNFKYNDHMITSGVSEIVFSIDGVDQASYEPYRALGNFGQAYDFMRNFSQAVRSAGLPIQTSWKYILFEHSSSEEQLSRLSRLAESAAVNDVHLVLTQMGPSSRRFFKALLDLRDEANENPGAFNVLRAMQAPVSASWLSGQFKKYIGHSPFPDSIEMSRPAGGLSSKVVTTGAASDATGAWTDSVQSQINYRVSCYLSIQENLDENLVAAKENLDADRYDYAGRSLVALATKLWRLYEARYDMLTAAHNELIRQMLDCVCRVPESYQREIFLKLECFQMSYRRPDTYPVRLFPCPIEDVNFDDSFDGYISSGNDPCFMLFSEGLSLPHGDIVLTFSARTVDGDLRGPKLYYDTGAGFTEENSVILTDGRLGNCEVHVDLPAGTKRLRLDPADAPGRFTLDQIYLNQSRQTRAATERVPS